MTADAHELPPPLPVPRFPSRRHLARLIRARQEMRKAIDARWGAGRRRSSSLTPGDGTSPPFGRARAAAERFPLRHLTTRSRTSCPGRDDIIADADRLLRGEVDVFGSTVFYENAEIPWTAHPFNRVPVSDAPWPRIRFLEGIGGADVKHLWELNRHHALLRLAQAFWLTGEARYAERCAAWLDSWIRENPPRRGINWTSSLEVGFRAVAWCWIRSLTSEADCWTPVRQEAFLGSLWEHARYVEDYDSVHHSPNTHLAGEGVALLYVGITAPEFARSARWRRLGCDILQAEIAEQILDDGMHFERSTCYHRYMAEFYLHAAVLCRSVGMPEAAEFTEATRHLLGATALLRMPDGTWPVLGDEDGGVMLRLTSCPPQDQHPVLAAGACLCRERPWSAESPVAAHGLAWWLVEDAEYATLADPPAPSWRSGALPTAGYYVGREHPRRDAWACVVDAGPHGGHDTGHAHTDVGHVEIVHGNLHLVSDPGSPTYTPHSAARDWFRSEAAHACLVVPGAPLAEPRGSFAWRRGAPEPAASWGDSPPIWWCTLSYLRPAPSGTVRHVRQIVLLRGHGVVVADWLLGERVPPFDIHWPIPHVGGLLDAKTNSFSADAFQMQWAALSPAVSVSAVLERVSRSPSYAIEQPAGLLRLGVVATAGSQALVVTAITERETRLVCAAGSGAEVVCELRTQAAVARLTLDPALPPWIGPAGGVGTR